jgi:hypothetical protein
MLQWSPLLVHLSAASAEGGPGAEHHERLRLVEWVRLWGRNELGFLNFLTLHTMISLPGRDGPR